jgi:hypothetical protein
MDYYVEYLNKVKIIDGIPMTTLDIVNYDLKNTKSEAYRSGLEHFRQIVINDGGKTYEELNKQ